MIFMDFSTMKDFNIWDGSHKFPLKSNKNPQNQNSSGSDPLWPYVVPCSPVIAKNSNNMKVTKVTDPDVIPPQVRHRPKHHSLRLSRCLH